MEDARPPCRREFGAHGVHRNGKVQQARSSGELETDWELNVIACFVSSDGKENRYNIVLEA